MQRGCKEDGRRRMKRGSRNREEIEEKRGDYN
jgi:hypothetical protein